MILNNLPFLLIRCLLLTLIIELITAFILGIRDRKDIINVILVNVLTNPVVVLSQQFLHYKYNTAVEIIGIIILELLAFLVEGLIYKRVLKYKELNPLILSLLLNATSFCIGELINIL
jgi:hypothetical protein